MLSHERIWKAIDSLASRQNVSVSGLARAAGLDPTSFNQSKRFGTNGRPRWPSTESIAKILDATSVSLESFFSLGADDTEGKDWSFDDILAQKAPPSWPVLAEAGLIVPASQEYRVPNALSVHDTRGALTAVFPFAVFHVTHDRFEPHFRKDAILLLGQPSSLAEGDRVLLFHSLKGILAGLVRTMDRGQLSIAPLRKTASEESEERLQASSAQWIAKILWASQ
ncbi:hypothetical protein [uncultured Cohaesibacter sp.]|uniref:hypothetical protein n=1 Tax=uncultured Cohaesibacter sp. TaxID=1002546 RepID=UPI00292EA85C|nr:hypothetical protein [uncultured Cohaesibacter sp.]